jgi:hypothetical protein
VNRPVFPEFKPQAFRSGDSVQVNMNGNIVPATVVRVSAGGNYWVKNDRGNEVLAKKNDIFPVASIRDTEESSPGGPEQSETSWESFTPDFLAEHLTGGGKAFYSPADDPTLNAPVHDTWMGEKSNLEQFVDFQAVQSGKAKISYDPPQKPQMERFKSLSESEIRTYLQTGGNFRYFDESVKSASPEGGLSLNDMMKDRERLATDDNVSAWFKYQMLQQQQQDAATAKEVVVDSSAATQKSAIDAVQTGLDAAGVVDPTPVSDGTNMFISLARAVKEPKNALHHVKNAAISGVSMIPYIGDLSKGAKYGGKATKAVNASESADVVKSTARTSDSVAASAELATQSDEGTFKQFMDDLFRAGGSNAKKSLPNTQKPSAIESIKRRFFGHGGGSANDQSAPPGGDSGGGGDNDPPDNKSTGSDPDDENIRKNLGGLKDTVVNLTGKLGKAAAATYVFAETQNFLNKAVIEYNRNLLKFNGELTSAYSKLDANRLFREFQHAQKQADPLSNLIRAQDTFEGTRQEFTGDWQVVATDIQTVLTKIANTGLKILDYISPFEEMWQTIRKLPIIRSVLGVDEKPFADLQAIKRLEEVRNRVADAQKRGRKL